MIRPDVLKPLPAQLTAVLGAVVATILFAAVLNLAPAVGLAYIDLPRLLGGLFVAGSAAQLWLGYALYLSVGIAAFPPVLIQLWLRLPGKPIGALGAAAKGVAAGIVVWILAGLLLPLLEAVSLANVGPFGFFAVAPGLASAFWYLGAHVAYGLAISLIAAMTRGIKPVDTLGWASHRHGDVREVALGLRPREGTGIYIKTKPR